MPEYYSSGRDPRRDYGERPVRSASRPQQGRPSGNARPQQGRPSGSARPQGSRPQQGHPSGSPRPQGNRPQQGRRPAPRRRKRTQPRFFIILGIIAIALIIALVLILGGGKGGKDPVQPMSTPEPAITNSGMSNATVSSQTGDFTADMDSDIADEPASDTSGYSTLADWLADSDAEVAALSAEEQVSVKDLSINPDLPAEWINVLLLGTDERVPLRNARTDTMIICSINTKNGEVKLTSIMRDLAVEFKNVGKYSGTYRINSANYFGGPEYAMKIVNECFGMNIQHYASVNFFGFQKIAQALGGIEVDISEAEMKVINRKAVNQAKIGRSAGVDESDQINEYLETYGPNTHLNGRQTLAYARVRGTDSDFTRAERQRTVLIKLMQKLKGKSAAEIIALVASLADNVSTNMDLNKITEIAITVLSSGLSDVETMRLPVNGTYKEERRNNQAMHYDCDWAYNSRELYNFIYE